VCGFIALCSSHTIDKSISILSKYARTMGRGCWDKRYSLEILSTKTKAGGGFPSYDMIFYGVPLCHSESMGDDCHYEYWIMTTHENFTAFVRTKITSPEPDPYRYDVTLIDETLVIKISLNFLER